MTEPGRQLCPDCGTDNEAHARFCSYCGNTLTRPWGLENYDVQRAATTLQESLGGSRNSTLASCAVEPPGVGSTPGAEPIPTEEETIELLELLARPSTLDPTLTQSEWTPTPAPKRVPETGVSRPPAAGWCGRPPAPPRVTSGAETGASQPGPASDSQAAGLESPCGLPGADRTRAGVAAVPGTVKAAHPRGGRAWFRTLTCIAGAALLTGLLGYLGAVFVIKPGKEDRLAAQLAPRSATGGRLSVEVPTGLPPNSLRVTVVQADRPVKAVHGELLQGLPPEKIGGVSLEPGSYVVRFLYRRTPLREVRAEIRRGQDTIIQPSRWQLADIEYSAGEAAARLGGPDQDGDSDVVHFRRTLTLDPDHVNAHLQMAAYELLNGKRADVERHLGNIRRLAPQHPDLAQLEALLKKRKRGS